MLRRQENGSVFCGADADLLDSDGVFAIKYKHDMEKLLEGIALPRMPWRAQYVKREHIPYPVKKTWNKSMRIPGQEWLNLIIYERGIL